MPQPIALSHSLGKLLAAENVKMYMLYCLTTVLSAIIYNAVTVCQAKGGSYLGYRFKYLRYVYAVLRRYFVRATDMSLGNNENVYRCLRIYILKGIDVLILIYLCGGYLSIDYFTKQAIHIFHPFRRITALNTVILYQ